MIKVILFNLYFILSGFCTGILVRCFVDLIKDKNFRVRIFNSWKSLNKIEYKSFYFLPSIIYTDNSLEKGLWIGWLIFLFFIGLKKTDIEKD